MLLYLCIVSVLVVLLFYSVFLNDTNNVIMEENSFFGDGKIIIRIDFLVLILFICFFCFLTAFRSIDMGNDTEEYVLLFKSIVQNGFSTSTRFEIGFIAYNYLISFLTSDAHAYLIITAMITYYFMFKYIKKYSKNYYLSIVLLFCFTFSIFFSMLRQNFAMLVCLFAYQKLKKGKSFLFVLMVLIASLFHITAIIFLVLLLNKLLPKQKFIMFIVLTIVAIITFSNILIPIIARIYPQYSNYFREDGIYVGTGRLGVLFETMRATFIFIFILFTYKDQNEYSLVISNAFILLTISILGFSVNLITRTSEFFLLVSISELPNAFEYSKTYNKKQALFIYGIALLSYFILILIFRPEWNHLYPYEFWWETIIKV